MLADLFNFFIPFKHLNKRQIAELANTIQIRELKAGDELLARASQDPLQYFLLKGEISLEADDGKKWVIKASGENARSPIAKKRPSPYAVKALTDIKVIAIDINDVINFSKNGPREEKVNLRQEELFQRFQRDLKEQRIVLPSLPDVALRIRQAILDENSNAQKIAKIISTDPAITAKILKVANSVFYRADRRIDNCAQAVTRLGLKVTSQMVTSFSMQELFKAKNPSLKKQMVNLWQHSREVAALSYNLARITPGFDAEQALLAGLLHDIGRVPILTYADQMPELLEDENRFTEIMSKLRGEIGGAILKAWGFDEPMVAAARDSEDWYRNPGDAPDYADIVILAQLHSFVGKPEAKTLPRLDEVPAFDKMALGQLTPETSLKVLEDSREKVEETMKLLG